MADFDFEGGARPHRRPRRPFVPKPRRGESSFGPGGGERSGGYPPRPPRREEGSSEGRPEGPGGFEDRPPQDGPREFGQRPPRPFRPRGPEGRGPHEGGGRPFPRREFSNDESFGDRRPPRRPYGEQSSFGGQQGGYGGGRGGYGNGGGYGGGNRGFRDGPPRGGRPFGGGYQQGGYQQRGFQGGNFQDRPPRGPRPGGFRRDDGFRDGPPRQRREFQPRDPNAPNPFLWVAPGHEDPPAPSVGPQEGGAGGESFGDQSFERPRFERRPQGDFGDEGRDRFAGRRFERRGPGQPGGFARRPPYGHRDHGPREFGGRRDDGPRGFGGHREEGRFGRRRFGEDRGFNNRPQQGNDPFLWVAPGFEDAPRGSEGDHEHEEISSPLIIAPRNARELALVVLEDYSSTGTFVSELFDKHVERSTITPQDRRLAYELICGVVRRELTLDTLLAPHLHRQAETIERPLKTILKLGLYQLLLCQGVPMHAAVNETVDLAKRCNMRWGGFANGVLRAAAKLLTDAETGGPASDALPVGQHRWRLLSRDMFPSPDDTPIAYYSQAFSFPAWLVERWITRFGADAMAPLGFWFNQISELALRTNLRKISRDELRQKLFDADFVAEDGPTPESIRLMSTTRIEALPGFLEGWLSVQDISAQHAARRLNPQPGERILDLCAAPGSKTCHIAELMDDRGEILATDVSPVRLRQITNNAERLGLTCIRTQVIGEDGEGLPDEQFDAVLADVPCSNTGVLSKRPEARWRITPAGLEELIGIQKNLIRLAASKTRPGGRFVYSTCSIEHSENEAIVKDFLKTTPGYRLVEEQRFMPGQPSDGGYQALIERELSAEDEPKVEDSIEEAPAEAETFDEGLES